MGSEFPQIDDKLKRWIAKQNLFFVATAPASTDGLVNCSPKGGDSFAVLGPLEVAYADFGGSGIETVAHVRENGRIVIMFCAFEGPPKILRLYGQAEVIEPQSDRFDQLVAAFPPQPMHRNIIRIDVTRIADSCGYGVPRYDYVGERAATANYLSDKTPDMMQAHLSKGNARSLDGLPGLTPDWQVRMGPPRKDA